MEEKVEVVKEFIQYNMNELKEEIINETRNYLDSQDEYYMKDIRNKMASLDFLEEFLINEDEIWDWAKNYYGEDDENEESE